MKQVVRALIPRSVRNWLRAPGRSLAWSWHRLRFGLGARDVCELRPGFRLTCHPLAYRYAYVAQVEDREQVDEYDCFIRHCGSGMTFFDVGAHFGLFALTALHYGGPASRALAIDASPVAADMIAVQARLNGVLDRLQILCACVCERVGTREMIDVGVQAAGYFVAPSAQAAERDKSSIPAITLDHAVAKTGLTPTHVKIDVEGFEESVLRGGTALLGGDRAPILFLELHNQIIRSQGADPGNVLSLLAEFGYTTWDVAGNPISRESLLSPDLVRFVAIKRASPA